MRWLQRFTRANDWKEVALDYVDDFTAELEEGRKLFRVSGTKIVAKLQAIPAEIEYYFRLSQEAEQILKFVERQEERAIVEKTQWYMDHYQRKISEQVARKYAEAHEDIATLYLLRCEIAMIRNDFMALFKGLEAQSFKLRDQVDLHKHMLEDAVFISPERD